MIQHVYVFGKKINESQKSLVEQTLKLIASNWQLHIYEPFSVYLEKNTIKAPAHSVFKNSNDLKKESCLITLGGDGTFLDAVNLISNSGIPMLGVNLGRMGFLANISSDEINESFEMLVKEDFKIENRVMLQVLMENNIFGAENIGLNELTIHKRDTSSMIKIHTYLNDEFLNSYWADGLIVATPTGSTAYSLSCGGPIILPDSSNFVITPVAPHSLNVRPVVIPDNKTLKFKVEGRTRYFMISLDSRSAIIDSSIEISVKKSSYPLQLIRFPNGDFASTIRRKLNWGLDVRN